MMASVVFTFIAFTALLILAGTFVTFWLIFQVFRSVFRGVFGIFAPPPRAIGNGARVCTRALCRAENPPDARYCRRCGKDLGAQYVHVRRVDNVVTG